MSDELSHADHRSQWQVEWHDPDEYFGYEPEPWERPAEVGERADGTRYAVPGTEAEHQYGAVTSRPDEPQFSEHDLRDYEFHPGSPGRGEDFTDLTSFDHDAGETVHYDDEEDHERGAIGQQDYHVYDNRERNIEVFWSWVSNMSDEATEEHSVYWRRVSTLLGATSQTLRTRAEALAGAWSGPAADRFLEEIGKTLYSLDEWDTIASHNAHRLGLLATAIQNAQLQLAPLYRYYYATRALYSDWWQGLRLPNDFQFDGMPIYNPQDPRWDPGPTPFPVVENILPFDALDADNAERVEAMLDDQVNEFTGQVVLVSGPIDVATERIRRLYHDRAADVIQELADEYVNAHYYDFVAGRRFQGPTTLNASAGGQPVDASGLQDLVDQLGGITAPGGPPVPGGVTVPDLGPGGVDNPALPGLPGVPTGPTMPPLAGAPSGLLAGPPTGGMLAGTPAVPVAPVPNLAAPAGPGAVPALPAVAAPGSGLAPLQQAQAVLAAAGLAPGGAVGSAGAGSATPVGVPGLRPTGVAAVPSAVPSAPPGAGAGMAPALPGATAGLRPAGGIIPPPPPPIVPPATANQQRRPNQPGQRDQVPPPAVPARLAGAHPAGLGPGVPPPVAPFVPPGRTTPQGRTPTAPQRVAATLPGTAGRAPTRTAGLAGVRGTSGYAAAGPPGTGAPVTRPGQRPADPHPAPTRPERVPVPGEHGRELWTVDKPVGVLRGSPPPRPAEHGTAIGSSG